MGTKIAPPFAFKDPEGTWTGISIELWREVAKDLGISYEFRETDLAGLLEGVKNKKLDLAIAAISVTQDREEQLDFSHSYYSTGLGIAVKNKAKSGWFLVAQRFFSAQFLKVLTVLVFVLLAVGFLGWLAERKANPEQFGGTKKSGILAGFWWAAVTMTTVGYGDKAPRTILGRLVGLFWMFASILIISSFTAAITASLTVAEFGSRISGPEDLPEVRVLCIENSTGEKYLKENRIPSHSVSSTAEAMSELVNGRTDALVYDAPMLKYLVNKNFAGKVRVLDRTLAPQAYAIALPQGSSLREPVNRVLLGKINEPWWGETLFKYMGR